MTVLNRGARYLRLDATERAAATAAAFTTTGPITQWVGSTARRVKGGILILMPTNQLTPEIINAAIEGFEQQKLRIDTQIAELRAMLPGSRPEPAATPEAPTGKRRKMSAAARKRMKEGQQRRWAKIRGESEPSSPSVTPEPSKPKRKLSAAGRAAIVAALKKRWAAAKTAPVAAKKSAARKSTAKAAPVKTAAKKTATKKAATAPVKAETQPTA